MEKEIATEEYRCGCGSLAVVGTELHKCHICGALQCPNCFDYESKDTVGYLCEEHISK